MQCILTPNKKAPYNLRLIVPAYGSSTIPDMSQDEWITRTISRNIEVGVLSVDSEYWVVEEETLPGGSLEEADAYFFDAWEWTGQVEINMDKARSIHMNKIRLVRNQRLVDLDIEYLKALEERDDDRLTAISKQKQQLRDIPETFDLTVYIHPDDLAKSWPSVLV